MMLEKAVAMPCLLKHHAISCRGSGINVGGEKIIQVRPSLFSVVGDNFFASMFSQRWHQLDAEGHLFC
jgi:hypothetical protein